MIVSFYANIIDCLEKYTLTCSYKKHFGFECMGCGIQRAFILLLKGEFVQSIKTYPPLIPIIMSFLVLIFHLIFDFKKGAFAVKILFVISSTLIFFNFLYKLIFK